MKKFGFTLAEVLITMAIIGVIAAVTLPALNVNVSENASITKYKKALSNLNNIGMIVAAKDNFNYSDVSTSAISDNTRGNLNGQLRRQMWAVMDRYGKIDRRMTNAGNNPGGGCAGAVGVIYYKDGTTFCYFAGEPPLNNGLDLKLGVIDVNGVKQPNRLSTCADDSCNQKDIADQFSVTLAGEEAYAGTIGQLPRDTMVPNYHPEHINATRAALWAADR